MVRLSFVVSAKEQKRVHNIICVLLEAVYGTQAGLCAPIHSLRYRSSFVYYDCLITIHKNSLCTFSPMIKHTIAMSHPRAVKTHEASR